MPRQRIECRGQASACSTATLDTRVFGSVDEASDRVGGLVEEVCDRGRDEQPDRKL
ncbi:MAG: hypothetical protein ACR2ND_15205 [Solirubrobacteraceae bacterium]